MDVSLHFLQKIIEFLEKKRILIEITPKPSFPDEPLIYNFTVLLKLTKKFTDGKVIAIAGGGYSFKSKKLALLKCLMEGMERFSNTCYKASKIRYSFYEELNAKALNPQVYLSEKKVQGKKIGWVEGKDLFNNQAVLLPAQIIYYNYVFANSEPCLTQLNSTGAAGGIDFETTLLRGIYEVVERDAFMTTYLAKIRAPKIELNDLEKKFATVNKLIRNITKFNLEVMIFNLENDLKIPTFLCIVIDRTGLGPAISLGLKSSLNQERAVSGAIEEALNSRPWLRMELWNRQESRVTSKANKNIVSILERGLFWLSPKMLKRISFLLDQPSQKLKIRNFAADSTKELSEVKRLLRDKGKESYFCDIGISEFKKIGLHFYKVVIPKLQPLFLEENRREIRRDRLKEVAKFFGQDKFSLNQTPHPFL